MNTAAKVFVSIGSNVAREHNIRSCIRALRACFGELQLSTLYETPAVGFSGDPFYNLVASFDTSLGVDELVAVLRKIETEHGRERQQERFAARTLDIDLLLYDDVIRHDGTVSIPRDEITKYGFVLGPLAELAGQRCHPELGVSYQQLWQDFDQSSAQLVAVEMPR